TKKGRLGIEFFDRASGDGDPAYVTYSPLILHVDRKVWQRAKERDGYARFIIAHEVGHILLHNDYEHKFSHDPSVQINFAQDEYSSEWQANKFAAYFLLPDRIVRQF